jgi:monofunctional biosynthetic peptidoglycan transglycosylase
VEVQVVDFSKETSTWQPVNDPVMGGLSSSRLSISSERTGVFEGKVSLANDGGFASVRTSVDLDLSGCRELVLRVRGDGHRYRIRLRTDDAFDGIAYQAGFPTRGEAWETIVVPLTQFAPSFRGHAVPDAPPLDLASIRQIGLMIADRQAGPFRLELGAILARTRRTSHEP